MRRTRGRSRYAGWRSPKRRGRRRAARSGGPRPTCARRWRRLARAATTTRNCAAPALGDARRPSSIWRARRWWLAGAWRRHRPAHRCRPLSPRRARRSMTLIAIHDLWISADLTENNLGHIDPGDEVAIVLDVHARRGAQGPRAQRRRRRQQRPAGTAGHAADDPEQQATGCARRSAFPVAVEFDRLRGAPAAKACVSAARPR
jgi:hypothetical protein